MKKLFTSVLFVVFSFCGLSLIALCSIAIFVHQDLSHPESMVQWAVKEVASGNPLYPDLRQWPHRLMPYGPLLCYPGGALLEALSYDNYGFHIYLIGRLQSLLYLLGIVVISGRILVSVGWPYWAAFPYVAAYLGLWSGIMVPSTSFRADFPGMFWCLLAAYLAFTCKGNPFKAYLALIPFLVSAAYKPSFWAFPAAFCLFYWVHYGFLRAFKWGAGLLLMVGAYIGIAQLVTGNMFLLNQIGGSSLGLTTQLFVISRDLLLHPGTFPLLPWDLCTRLLLGVAVSIWLYRRSANEGVKGFALYYLIALPVNLLTFFKVGAGLNYALEAYVVSGIVLGVAAIELYEQRSKLKPMIKGTLASAGILFLVAPAIYFSYINIRAALQTAGRLGMPPAQAALMKLPGTALLGDQAFTHPVPAAHALSDPVPFAQLSVRGLIPKKPLEERIRQQAFSHFVMSSGMKYLFFSPDKAKWVGAILEEHYTPSIVLPEYEIWIPKTSAEAETTETLSAPVSTE